MGDGVWRRRYASFDLNIGVVRGADAFCVVDTRSSLRQAAELADELRYLGPQPVRWVVNTHGHFDHCYGNGRFAPPADLWGHEGIVGWLAAHDAAQRQHVAAFDAGLATDVAGLEVRVPDHLVGEAHTLDLGDRAVGLHWLGRGHTDHDLVVTAPGVAFAGDLVEESAPPWLGDDSYPLDWPATAAALVELVAPTTSVVPGHGDVVQRPFVARQAAELAAVAAEARRWHAAGADAATALAEGTWPWPRPALATAVGRCWDALGGA